MAELHVLHGGGGKQPPPVGSPESVLEQASAEMKNEEFVFVFVIGLRKPKPENPNLIDGRIIWSHAPSFYVFGVLQWAAQKYYELALR